MASQLSKSEKKRRAKGIEQLVSELAELAAGEIGLLPCPKEVCDEIAAAKNLKGGARKRQLKYATKLLRDEPIEDLYHYMASKKGSALKEKRQFQEIEHLRNLLMSEAVELYEELSQSNGYANEYAPIDFLHDSETITVIVSHLPEVDEVQLKNAAMQYARTRNKKFSRELFRVMKAAVEKKQFSNIQDTEHGI